MLSGLNSNALHRINKISHKLNSTKFRRLTNARINKTRSKNKRRKFRTISSQPTNTLINLYRVQISKHTVFELSRNYLLQVSPNYIQSPSLTSAFSFMINFSAESAFPRGKPNMRFFSISKQKFYYELRYNFLRHILYARFTYL